MRKRFPASLLVLLMLTVDSSLQSSIVFDRSSAWWSPWLYKIGMVSVADIILIFLTLITVYRIVFRLRLLVSPYLALCGLAVAYVGVGLAYNMVVYPLWKTFLYDLKVVLYLTVPYLFLMYCADKGVRAWFTPWRIFLFLATGNLIDFLLVYLRGSSEYPSYLGLPTVPQIIPLFVAVVGVIFAKRPLPRFGFLLLLSAELLFTANRLSLGSLYNLGIALGVALIISTRLNFGFKFHAMLAWVLCVNLLSLLLLENPLGWTILGAKSEGAETRRIQMSNALLNAQRNIPGLIGKGLGSTWFEYLPIPSSDIFSVGTSVGATPQASLAAPVKFIFNFGPASMLHKWGVIGSILLIFLLVRYFHTASRALARLSRLGLPDGRLQCLRAALLISTVFVFENFTYVGNLRNSLATSLLAFYVERTIRDRVSRQNPRQGVASSTMRSAAYGSAS